MTNKRKRNDKTSPKWWHCHLGHILRWRIVHLIREEIKARSFRLRTIHQHIKRLLGWRYVLIAGSHGYKLKEVTKKKKRKGMAASQCCLQELLSCDRGMGWYGMPSLDGEQ